MPIPDDKCKAGSLVRGNFKIDKALPESFLATSWQQQMYLNLQERRNQITDTITTNSTMTANAFNEILDRIRGSNLNYQIQLSPF